MGTFGNLQFRTHSSSENAGSARTAFARYPSRSAGVHYPDVNAQEDHARAELRRAGYLAVLLLGLRGEQDPEGVDAEGSAEGHVQQVQESENDRQ